MLRSLCQISLLLLILLIAACKNWRQSLRIARTPRQAHADSFRDKNAAARWTADADSALAHPFEVSLPYRESGHIPARVNAAAAFRFDLRQGERIYIKAAAPNERAAPFIELYELNANASVTRIESPEPGMALTNVAENATTYLLLVQGRLDSTSGYTLTIARGPSLAYPTLSPAKNRIGSVWGDSRDAGARRHEGVDIFAPKGSPALAAASGRIVRLTDGGLGGKTVWLRPEGRNISLYYAHLDSQWVREGDYVRRGDTLGQVGNTGNARSTAAHLHFGVYTAAGAIDPAPFIRIQDTASPAPKISSAIFETAGPLRKPIKLVASPHKTAQLAGTLDKGASVTIVAVSGEYLRFVIGDSVSRWTRYERTFFFREGYNIP